MNVSTFARRASKHSRSALLPGLILVAVATLIATPLWAANTPASEASGTHRSRVLENYAKLPMSFVENRGQSDKRVAFYLHSPGHSLYFTRRGHALRLFKGEGDLARAHVVKVDLVGANAKRVESRVSARGIVSYFKGPRAEWQTAIPTHSTIGYVQPWPGIDLTYTGGGGQVESIYTIAPHADPALIRLRYSGQDSLELDETGNLVYTTSVGEVKESAPVLYQEIDGRRIEVAGRYRLIDANTVAFEIPRYDRNHALVIDPTLVYSGFIGGSADDQGFGVAVDSAGNTYVAGYTGSTEATFPTLTGPDVTHNTADDAFVAKVNAAGTALIYAGYIGGQGSDLGRGIAVDSAGNAYVTGYTNSNQANFPVVVGPSLESNGFIEAFVAKVNPQGTALIYCGYIGGNGSDLGFAIAVNAAGNAFVTGNTDSGGGFPVVVGPDLTLNGAQDAFIAKVNVSGSGLDYAGYIGGSGIERGNGVAVDGAGNAYVTGTTASTAASFPVLVGPDLTHNGNNDAFVAKVNPSGTALEYAGYIGGTGIDRGNGIAVNVAGNAFVTGLAASTEASFPVVGGPDVLHNGGDDAFIAKLTPDGSALIYAGYIGGIGVDEGLGIALDAMGNAHVAGLTTSTAATFPVSIGPDLSHNGGTDVFVAKVNSGGTALVYAGYIGGNGTDQGNGIAVGTEGNAYVAGATFSNVGSFPGVVGPDLLANGNFDAFIAHVQEPQDGIFSDGFE